jgi:hypothetical protein
MPSERAFIKYCSSGDYFCFGLVSAVFILLLCLCFTNIGSSKEVLITFSGHQCLEQKILFSFLVFLVQPMGPYTEEFISDWKCFCKRDKACN